MQQRALEEILQQKSNGPKVRIKTFVVEVEKENFYEFKVKALFTLQQKGKCMRSDGGNTIVTPHIGHPDAMPYKRITTAIDRG